MSSEQTHVRIVPDLPQPLVWYPDLNVVAISAEISTDAQRAAVRRVADALHWAEEIRERHVLAALL
jgi:hypothetical protein